MRDYETVVIATGGSNAGLINTTYMRTKNNFMGNSVRGMEGLPEALLNVFELHSYRYMEESPDAVGIVGSLVGELGRLRSGG